LGVKPAFEDVDVGSFLAFLPTVVEDQIEPDIGDLYGMDIGASFA
jgi:hypothetical protein